MTGCSPAAGSRRTSRRAAAARRPGQDGQTEDLIQCTRAYARGCAHARIQVWTRLARPTALTHQVAPRGWFANPGGRFASPGGRLEGQWVVGRGPAPGAAKPAPGAGKPASWRDLAGQWVRAVGRARWVKPRVGQGIHQPGVMNKMHETDFQSPQSRFLREPFHKPGVMRYVLWMNVCRPQSRILVRQGLES